MRLAHVFIVLGIHNFVWTCCFGDSLPVGYQPNIVLLLADDLGMDLFSYGHPSQEFNEIDRMAREGVLFKNWLSCDSVCTPSRAAILTGRIPTRVGLYPSNSTDLEIRVLHAWDKYGLPRSEMTVAEALKSVGYNTGFVGKWHLGMDAFVSGDGYYLPHNHGFDYVGYNLPISNEWQCDDTLKYVGTGPQTSRCFAFDNSTLIQQPIDHTGITDRLVDDTKTYLRTNAKDSNPFFFMLSFIHVHVSLFASERFKGTSRRGPFGDNVAELAWAVGEIKQTLIDLDIHEETLVIFLSDNGGLLEECTLSGDRGFFSGGKVTYMDGGLRVPAIAYWPGTIEADTISYQLMSSLDIFPTLATLAGYDIDSLTSAGVIIDGQNMVSVFLENNEEDRTIFHYCGTKLFAARNSAYKLVFKRQPIADDSYLSTLCNGTGYPLTETFYASSCEDDAVDTFETPLLFHIHSDPRELFTLSWVSAGDTYHDIGTMLLAEATRNQAEMTAAKPLLGYVTCPFVPCANWPTCKYNYNATDIIYNTESMCPDYPWSSGGSVQ